MKFTDIKSFLEALEAEHENAILAIKLLDDAPKNNFTKYLVQLKYGWDKIDFQNEVMIPFVQERHEIGFGEGIELVITEYPAGGNNSSLSFYVNEEYDDEFEGEEFDDPVQTFEVIVGGRVIKVNPLGDETFDIYEADLEFLGNIFPSVKISGNVEWKTGDMLPEKFVQQVGEAIERFEM